MAYLFCIFNFVWFNNSVHIKIRLLSSLEPPKKFSVGGGGLKVTLVFCLGPKPKFCSLDLDQTEQLVIAF